MHGHVGQPTNYNLMNEVYETERNVSIRSENRQAQQYGMFITGMYVGVGVCIRTSTRVD